MPLTKNDPIEKWIKDFVNSTNPKFHGKSKDDRIKMAKAAYYSAIEEEAPTNSIASGGVDMNTTGKPKNKKKKFKDFIKRGE